VVLQSYLLHARVKAGWIWACQFGKSFLNSGMQPNKTQSILTILILHISASSLPHPHMRISYKHENPWHSGRKSWIVFWRVRNDTYPFQFSYLFGLKADRHYDPLSLFLKERSLNRYLLRIYFSSILIRFAFIFHCSPCFKVEMVPLCPHHVND
jgi:hypothetical protein